MSDDLTTAYNLGYTCAKDMARDEIERLRAENEKLMSAYNNGYHDALEAAADLAFKILTEIEGIDFEVPAKIRELHSTVLKESGE